LRRLGSLAVRNSISLGSLFDSGCAVSVVWYGLEQVRQYIYSQEEGDGKTGGLRKQADLLINEEEKIE
jgi:hypothetical protein